MNRKRRKKNFGPDWYREMWTRGCWMMDKSDKFRYFSMFSGTVFNCKYSAQGRSVKYFWPKATFIIIRAIKVYTYRPKLLYNFYSTYIHIYIYTHTYIGITNVAAVRTKQPGGQRI